MSYRIFSKSGLAHTHAKCSGLLASMGVQPKSLPERIRSARAIVVSSFSGATILRGRAGFLGLRGSARNVLAMDHRSVSVPIVAARF